MIRSQNSLLFKKVTNKKYSPEHVAEVGVGRPEISNVYLFIQEQLRATLVEPDPESIRLIKSSFAKKSNVTLHEAAVCDFNGSVELYNRKSSTFISSLQSSPAIVNDNANLKTTEKFTADAILFSTIDDGTIDLISIDTEGSEWFVIKNMVSRPTVISIETHGGAYINPYYTELSDWMKDNNYILWYKDKSDSVYVRKNTLKITFIDHLNLFMMNLKIFIKSKIKRISIFRKKFFDKRSLQ